MGVDYSSNFGIGYKIQPIHNETDEDESKDTGEILEEIEFPDGIEYFESGEANYTGGENQFYICLEKPFENGLDLSEGKKILDLFLLTNNIEPMGEFGLHGGLHVY